MRGYRREVWLVLGLSLGQSAVYSIVSIVAKLTESTPLSQQTTTLNESRSVRPLLDLTYQLLGIGFALVPVALALYLLSRDGGAVPARERLGLDVPDGRRAAADAGWGAALAALIGIPGLGFYFLAQHLGVNTTVAPSGLSAYWWTVPVLVLSALQNAVLEEVVVVGFLMTRLRQVGWPLGWVIAASALLRGSYHLYQGFGGFLGNCVMGAVFAWWFHKRGRVLPLVAAHWLLDICAFVGYQLLR
ncbi:CPBP family intramembrane glutamic endopeptidase [Cumulibacter manganitolerans]|uniref:CPBP family intramembrane glutamic endopeptidase n=1 Tax=Cumulibacter manganitolerans TaxID=1884992 RepID=UPI001E5076A1|nr:CPBP family intramembrane glutamic endopeptidase [Cumulibacter manganitolerans]